MLCDFNVESYLEFINEHDGIHSFRWTTLHGCPTNIKQSHNNIQPSKLSTTTNGADDESGSETEPEKEKDDDELLPQSGVSTARRWMAVILVIVVSVFFFFFAMQGTKEATFSLNPGSPSYVPLSF